MAKKEKEKTPEELTTLKEQLNALKTAFNDAKAAFYIVKKLFNPEKEIIEAEAVLKDNIPGKNTIFSAIAGTILILAGLFITLETSCNKCWPDCFDFCCCNLFIHLFFTYLPLILTSIAGIILIVVYKSRLKQADIYKSEIIALNELKIALAICETIPEGESDKTTIVQKIGDTDKTTLKNVSQRTKTKQQIIETLLSRCN